jgi:hypothetical protein
MGRLSMTFKRITYKAEEDELPFELKKISCFSSSTNSPYKYPKASECSFESAIRYMEMLYILNETFPGSMI